MDVTHMDHHVSHHFTAAPIETFELRVEDAPEFAWEVNKSSKSAIGRRLEDRNGLQQCRLM